MLTKRTFPLLCTAGFIVVFIYTRSTFSPVFKFMKAEYLEPYGSHSIQKSLIEKRKETNISDRTWLFPLRKRLSPFASITQRLEFADPPLNKTKRNIVYQTGTGLERITYKNVTTWQEFGVMYIPSNLSRLPKSQLADVFVSDYEPYIPYDHDVFFEGRKHKKVQGSERKIILARLAGMDPVQSLQPLKVCPEFPCVHTTNKKYFRDASAITFKDLKETNIAPARRPDQIFIFYYYEPLHRVPVLSDKLAGWTDAFNWTMSYNVDADIFMPYGLIRKRPILLQKDYKTILSLKTELIATFVSHCKTESKRELYIRQLQEFVPVHVYGRCGGYKCKREHDLECFSNVSRKYKFYLSFENSICDDYISEKFYKNLRTDSILVARGSMTYFKHVPDGIYINVDEFQDVSDLASYLIYLDHHEEEYLNILRRKDQFFAAYGNYPHKVGKTVWIKYNWENVPLCEVCQRLWNIDLYSQVYPDIAQWTNERVCRKPSEIVL